MFIFAALFGIYSYLIFTLGILGLFYRGPILLTTFIFIVFSLVYFKPRIKNQSLSFVRKTKNKPLLFLFFCLASVNLVGAFGPELSFDALWYHLTIPKIFLQNHSIFFIPGGLFYYSVMPKLGEMLFIPGLMMGSEIIPKLIQWGFGILAGFAVYKITRKFFDEKISIIAVLIFYSSLVVSWQSTTAYIDLARTFFEIMALWGFIKFYESKNREWLIESAVMMGLAISTKLIALGSIPIFGILLFAQLKNKKEAIGNIFWFCFVSIFISLPWLFFAFLSTGNPAYPLLTKMYPTILPTSLLNPLNTIKELVVLFFRADDPISPVYIIVLPLLLIVYKKLNKELRIILLYSFLALIIWYITPRTGGGRFILPYLPAFSVLSAAIIAEIKIVWLRKYLVGLVILICLITIAYRGLANGRYLPVILGYQTKQDFLTKNLNFNFGDFYDTDRWFAKNISDDDKVLLYGFHNLYYADFPFIHESYVKEGDRFNYIATQNAKLPHRFSHWNLIYTNDLTNVKVYSLGGIRWLY